MTENIHETITIDTNTRRKRKTYSIEFKWSIVQACKAPNASIASIALQHQINTNLVSKWIRSFDNEQRLQSLVVFQPAFIALDYPETLNSPPKMLSLHLTVVENTEIMLKWQASEILALAALIKALAA